MPAASPKGIKDVLNPDGSNVQESLNNQSGEVALSNKARERYCRLLVDKRFIVFQ